MTCSILVKLEALFIIQFIDLSIIVNCYRDLCGFYSSVIHDDVITYRRCVLYIVVYPVMHIIFIVGIPLIFQ